MHKAIVSDTSCLILLEKIGELALLNRLFGTVVTTTEVADEYGLPLPNWIEVQNVSDKNYQTILEAYVDKGEASTIALAIEMGDSLLIIDDLKGRKFAQQLGLSITGTFGIIVDAKLAGIIPSVKPVLEKVKHTNFRISQKLEEIILLRANEN